MTQEQKAKVYDEALERASKLRFQNPFDTVSQMMEHIFPELAESEDEKIRKELIEHIKANCESDFILFQKFSPDEVIAWLERQGKSKWNENDEHHWMMCVACVEECATQEREDFSKTIDWLKSLKQRMEEQ